MKGWILALLLLLTLGGCSADDTAVTTTVPDALPVEQEAVEQTKPDTQTSQPENRPSAAAPTAVQTRAVRAAAWLAERLSKTAVERKNRLDNSRKL